ncbi:MAG: hypothetical protein WED04_10895 [Promethearchaeati archaeon SRVP18_Atabeyarchaeia-1]
MPERERRYGAIAPILTVMLITLVMAFLAAVMQLASTVSMGPFNPGQQFIPNLLVVGLGLVIAVVVFYVVLKGSITVGVRVAVSIFIFSAIMTILLYVKFFLNMYGASSSAIFVIVSLVAYVASFLGVMAIFDVLSRRVRNAMFAVCSGVLGAFAGALIPPLALLFVLLLMAALDALLMRRHTVEKTKKTLEDYDQLVIMKLSYAGRNWAIGLADLLSYSMLIANCFANFGLVASLASLFLVVLGFFVGSWRAGESGQIAGLPLAIGLGLIPLIIYIALAAML